ncbi:MAG: AAA family ATPase [Clostridia bacterium]|nr:AAA family ATPase [Clostridia bacterium]
MIIRKINITSFGALSGFCAELSDGLNVISGANESGKSTILAFIRFVLYGLPSRRSEEGVLEYDRALSWLDGRAEGSIEIECEKGAYRIERRGIRADNRDGYSEKCQIIDLSTGSVAFKGEVPGQVFLGVPSGVWDSTSSVKQQALSSLSGSEIGSSIENILFSADEAIYTERALTRLNTARRQFRLQRGTGGKIDELTAERDTLRRRLIEAEEASKNLLTLRSTVERARKLCAELRTKLTSAEDRLRAFETIQTLKRFDMLHAGEAKVAALTEEKNALIAEHGFEGRLPDRAYVAELDSLSRRLASAESDAAKSAGELAGLRSEQLGDTNLAARAEDIERTGGPEAVADKYKKLRSSVGARLAFGIIFAILGTALCVGSMACYFLKLFPWLTMPISSGAAVGGLIVALIGISIAITSGKARRRAQNYIFELGIEDEKPKKKEIVAHCAACLEAKGEIDDFAKRIGTLEQAHAKKSGAVLEIIYEARSVLGRFGIDGENQNIAEVLALSAEKYAKVAEKSAALDADIEKYSASVRESKAKLEGEDEAALRAHLTPAAKSMLDLANLTTLKQERDEYAARLDAARMRLLDSEKNLGIIEGTCENPNRIAALLEETEAELAEADRKYAAIVLAHESISNAGESLRRNVTPRLRASAGALMKHITDGKYSDFGIGEDFSLSILTESGTRPITSLSAGTRDTAYFALRTALSSMLFPADRPPMILDEVFSQLDDTRAASLLDLLTKIAEESQVILLTCHSREAEILNKNALAFSHITL